VVRASNETDVSVTGKVAEVAPAAAGSAGARGVKKMVMGKASEAG
jgi:hypothetical protein